MTAETILTGLGRINLIGSVAILLEWFSRPRSGVAPRFRPRRRDTCNAYEPYVPWVHMVHISP
jgi:hypothetical protein